MFGSVYSRDKLYDKNRANPPLRTFEAVALERNDKISFKVMNKQGEVYDSIKLSPHLQQKGVSMNLPAIVSVEDWRIGLFIVDCEPWGIAYPMNCLTDEDVNYLLKYSEEYGGE